MTARPGAIGDLHRAPHHQRPEAQRDGLSPNGTRLAYAWDVAGTEDWQRYVQTYDAQARLVRQQDENDDGTRRIEEWDYGGLQPWQNRVTLSMDVVGGVYKDYEQRDTLHEPVPDDSIVDVIERLWDPANQAAWISILREYDIFSENSNHWLRRRLHMMAIAGSSKARTTHRTD